jgi:hypothetical protein
MIQSRDDLIMEMAEEYELNHMEENDDDDDEGNAVAPLAPVPAAMLENSTTWKRMMTMMMKETPSHPVEMVPKQEATVAHEIILADAEPEPQQPRLFNMIMSDYEESPSRMENGPHELDNLDDLYDLDDDPNKGRSDMDEWFPEDGSNDRV